eukprot:10293549-Ditylum_brightwellii.AAC.1
MMLNYFPPSGNGGVSDNLCPAKVVDGVLKLDLSKKRIRFGCFAQVYDSADNTFKERTIDAIVLYPANATNGYYFMSLVTGK